MYKVLIVGFFQVQYHYNKLLETLNKTFYIQYLSRMIAVTIKLLEERTFGLNIQNP